MLVKTSERKTYKNEPIALKVAVRDRITTTPARGQCGSCGGLVPSEQLRVYYAEAFAGEYFLCAECDKCGTVTHERARKANRRSFNISFQLNA